MNCEICGLTAHNAGVLFRQNKGQIPSKWRCAACNSVPVDSEVQEITDILIGKERKDNGTGKESQA